MPHALGLFLLLGLLGCGAETGAPELEVMDPWARPRMVRVGDEGPLPGATSGVYLEIRNRGPAADRLLGGETPSATEIQIHESYLEEDVVRMRRVDGVDLPAGGVVALKPGGLHLMLLDLRQSLQEGDTLSLTLTFQHAPPARLRIPVRGVGQG